jgi:hypothetical protein
MHFVWVRLRASTVLVAETAQHGTKLMDTKERPPPLVSGTEKKMWINMQHSDIAIPRTAC